MPRGAKGWPVSFDTRLPWWMHVVSFLVFAAALPAGTIWLRDHGPNAHHPDAASKPFLYAFFACIGVLTSAVIFVFTGRGRVTPTTMLWVPGIGRPRWVRFDDVSRMRFGPGGYTFDAGRVLTFPMVKHTWATRRTWKADRDRVSEWLDQCFRPIEQPASKVRRRIPDLLTAFSFALMFGTAVGGQLFVKHSTWLARTIASRPPADQSLIKALVAGGIPMAGIGLSVLVDWSARHFLRLNTKPRMQWRQRREQWEGFEVLQVANERDGTSSNLVHSRVDRDADGSGR